MFEELFQQLAIIGIFLCVLLSILYVLPSIIALVRKTKNSNIISLINVLLGWTGIGWFACLLWAILDEKRILPEKDVVAISKNEEIVDSRERKELIIQKFCSECGKKIKKNAKFCEFCGAKQ